MRTAVSILALTAAITSPALAGISYTFDSDAQGWGIFSDGRDFQWDGTIGNNGLGAIRAVDITAGNYWFFSAPTTDLGDLSALYGNSISYDILGIQGNQNIDDRADIILSGGGIQIGIAAGVAPVLGQWTSWDILVDASADWKIVSSATSATLSSTDATEADFQTVLANLSNLYIRGEYTSGGDQSAIDNVNFVPAPSTLALLGLSTVAFRRRR
tara:strand:+ start:14512 stop:15153 length:642 start_codon:yes stop_codon:yes gene_type:complete